MSGVRLAWIQKCWKTSSEEEDPQYGRAALNAKDAAALFNVFKK